jgi:hypothetical protein
MNDTLLNVARFAFVFILPITLTVGVALALFCLGALFYVLDHPAELREELRRRIEVAFRRPPKPARNPGPDHYYQAYWSRNSSHQAGEK